MGTASYMDSPETHVHEFNMEEFKAKGKYLSKRVKLGHPMFNFSSLPASHSNGVASSKQDT